MSDKDLIKALRSMTVETGSLVCLGCGNEHSCGVRGCAIINEAAARLETLTDLAVLCDQTDFNGTYVSIGWLRQVEKQRNELRAKLAGIVHCRDCMYRYHKDMSAYCKHIVGPCKPDGFCDRGERRGELMRKHSRQAMARRAVYVGCQFCGETDKPLRNYGSGKICPTCLKRQGAVPELGTRKEKQ